MLLFGTTLFGCEMNNFLIVVMYQVFNLGCSHSKSTWTTLLTIGQSDTFALCYEVEVMVTNIHVIDREAVTVLPCMSHLQVTDPGIAVKSAFFLIVVVCINIIPTDVVTCLSLNALM